MGQVNRVKIREQEPDSVPRQRVRRPFKLDPWVFVTYGRTPGCHACEVPEKGAKYGVQHTDACRRIEEAVASTPEGAARIEEARKRMNEGIAEEMERRIRW